jgi:hypothetical protein
MAISLEQYDRVAKWLDGQDIALDAQELELAGQVRNGLSSMGAAFDMPMPSGAIQRAVDSLPRRRPVIMRLAPYIGAAAAAAAAIIVLAVGFVQQETRPPVAGPVAGVVVKPVARAPAVASSGIELINAYEMPKELDLDIIAGQVDELQAHMTSSPGMVDMQIDAVQLQVDNLLMEEYAVLKPEG